MRNIGSDCIRRGGVYPRPHAPQRAGVKPAPTERAQITIDLRRGDQCCCRPILYPSTTRHPHTKARIRRLRWAAVLTAMLVITLLAPRVANAQAQMNVAAELSPRMVFDDETASVVITITNPTKRLRNVHLKLAPQLSMRGPFGPEHHTSIVNGSRSSSLKVTFEITPARGTTGSFAVGPATVVFGDGSEHPVAVGSLQVAKRPQVGATMRIRLGSPRGPVGQPVGVVYEILYSGDLAEGSDDLFARVRRPLGLEALDLSVLNTEGLDVKPAADQASAAVQRLRLNQNVEILAQRGVAETPDGTFRTLRFAFEMTPKRSGPIDLSGSARVALVTGTRVGRDLFGRRVRIPDEQGFDVEAQPQRYEVAPLPAVGKPEAFTGAVGRFAIDVAATPTEVNAFDPITLTVRIGGKGLFETLTLPAWHKLTSLTAAFDISSDVDPGGFKDGVKTFTTTFRARDATTRQIPPLPLPHYDPWEQRYKTVFSQAIPITVRAVQTVHASDAVSSHASRPGKIIDTHDGGKIIDTHDWVSQDLPLRNLIGIPANYATAGLPRTGQLNWSGSPTSTTTLATLVAPACVLFVLYVFVGAWRRMRVRASRGGLLRLRAQLGSAQNPGAWALAFHTFLQDQLELPAGEITGSQLRDALVARRVPAEVVERACFTLDQLAAARFGYAEAGVLDAEAIVAVAKEVKRCTG